MQRPSVRPNTSSYCSLMVTQTWEGIPNLKWTRSNCLVTKSDTKRENNLDLYVFVVDDDVHQEYINGLVSQRDQEKYFFKLQDLTKIQEMFDDMIDESTSVGLCGIVWEGLENKRRAAFPWLAQITAGTSNCMGSLVASSYILTAAHCFKEGITPSTITVKLGKDLEEILMSNELVEAAFASDMDSDNSPKTIKNIAFKLGKYRDACVEDAIKAKEIDVKNAREAVTDSFLCSGGIELKTDDVACKGDSGGASYVNKKGRVIQVGVISWGVKDICKEKKRFTSDADSRDYHSNLFSEKIRSFLKEHLEKDRIGHPLKFL